MTNLNDIIKDKALEYAKRKHESEFMINKCAGHFTAGASFATTDPSILQAILQPFAEWVDSKAVRCGQHDWTIGAGNDKKRYSTEELIQKYFADNKQKEDEGV